MLYGHIETADERVDHMLRARALQDETGGFQAFIPLAFHPDNNQMRKLPAPSAADTLRVHAVARLMLDNIPHVKAFWIATGVEVAQTALWFGVDDLDGTVQEEKIYHMAGSSTPEAMTYVSFSGSSRPPDGNQWSATRFITWWNMLIPLLTGYEKTHIAERQPLPERYLGLSDEEMDRAHRVRPRRLSARAS